MTSLEKQKDSTIEKLAKELENPALVQTLNYLKFSAKYRRPFTMVPRMARVNNSNTNTNYLPTVKPPYNNASLDRFEDCFRSDKLVQNGIVKRTELVLGKHGRIVMDTTEEFDNEDDRAKALQKVQDNPAYKEARKQIQALQTKPQIDFHNKMKSAIIQGKVYGRAAIEEVGSDENGLPEALHVLNSKRLGQIEIDPKTWQFLGVHYLDLSKGSSGMDDLLEADELIYFANRDYHVSPGSLYYGLSELEGVVDGSDSKRIAKQEDIKEIMKSNWAPFLILKFANPNISVTQMQEVVNGMSPGLPFAHKQDIEAQTINLQSDLKKITDAVDFLNRESLRELGVPAYISGYEQIANYANSQQVLLAYKEIELESDRTWVKDIIQPQWLNKHFYRLIGINLEAGDEPEVKLSYEFDDVSFETTLDKVNRDLLLFDRQLISGEKVLKDAGYEDSIEEYKLLKEQQDQEKKLRLQQFLQNPFGRGPFGRPLNPFQQQDQQQQQQPGEGVPAGSRLQGPQTTEPRIKSPNEKAISTTMRKRQGSVDLQDLYDKISDTLDAIAER